MDPLLAVTLLAAFVGALVSAGINVGDRLLQRSRQRKALLVAFTTDLAERFMRTTLYYNQTRRGFISFSALHEATDPTMLVKLAEVIKDQNIIHTIIELNNNYYQIQRHVLEASKFAAEQFVLKNQYEYLKQNRETDDPDIAKAEQDLHEATARAHSAQSRALAFFGFDEMLEWTKVLIKYARDHAEGSWLASLDVKFRKRLEEKKEADRSAQQLT